MEQILFHQLPERLQMRTHEAHVKFIGYTDNPQGRSYFIYEKTELSSYLHIKNEFTDDFVTMMKVPFAWLRLSADRIPHLAEHLEEIVHYANLEKDDE